MSVGEIDAVVDTLEFDTAKGLHPNIIFIANTVFAVAYEGDSDTVKVVTFTIDLAGNISAVVDTQTIATGITPTTWYLRPR